MPSIKPDTWNIPKVLLRSTSIFQDGRQGLGVLCRTLTIVQEPLEHEFTTAATPFLYSGARGKARVEIQAEALNFYLNSVWYLFAWCLFAWYLFAWRLFTWCLFRVMLLSVTPFHVMPFSVMLFRVMLFRAMPFRVMPLRVTPFRGMPLSVIPFREMP